MSEENQNAIGTAPEETIVEVSATSHLKSVRPIESEPKPDEVAELPEVKLPKTLKAIHEALGLARSEPDAHIRRHKVGVLTKHLHELSQMPDAPALDAKKLNAAQNRGAEEIQMEMLGRQFPVVKKWVSELKTENEALKKELSALKKK